MRTRFVGLQRDRLDALVDGVYAIALTLLVLDLRLPIMSVAFDQSYASHDLLPKLVAYGIAFSTVGLCWLGHYYFSTVVRYTDYTHVTLNLLPLAFVALVPFSAAALGTYPRNSLAVAAYTANALVISLIYRVNWQFVRHLIPQGISRKLLRAIGNAIWLLVGLEGCALVLAFINPIWGIVMAAIVVPLGFGAVGYLAPEITRATQAMHSDLHRD